MTADQLKFFTNKLEGIQRRKEVESEVTNAIRLKESELSKELTEDEINDIRKRIRSNKEREWELQDIAKKRKEEAGHACGTDVTALRKMLSEKKLSNGKTKLDWQKWEGKRFPTDLAFFLCNCALYFVHLSCRDKIALSPPLLSNTSVLSY